MVDLELECLLEDVGVIRGLQPRLGTKHIVGRCKYGQALVAEPVFGRVVRVQAQEGLLVVQHNGVEQGQVARSKLERYL